jgi:hypothetical protein
MQFERDERGDVKPETVVMTIKEAKRWIYKPDQQVPSYLLAEVKRHRAAKEAAEHKAELDARFPDRQQRAADPHFRRSWLWQEIAARQPEVSA